MGRIPLGSDAKMFIGTTEVKSAQNVTLNLDKGEADVTTRGSSGWKETLSTNKDASIEFSLVWDTEDSSFSKIATAYFSNEALEFYFLDGPKATGTGLHAWCGVFKFSRDEQLDGALVANCTVKPTYAGSDAAKKPQWLDKGTPIVLDGETP